MSLQHKFPYDKINYIICRSETSHDPLPTSPIGQDQSVCHGVKGPPCLVTASLSSCYLEWPCPHVCPGSTYSSSSTPQVLLPCKPFPSVNHNIWLPLPSFLALGNSQGLPAFPGASYSTPRAPVTSCFFSLIQRQCSLGGFSGPCAGGSMLAEQSWPLP